MKRSLLLTLAGLAIGFVLPNFAQQTDTADPQIREQIVALFGKFTEAWNNNDAAALAALYTKDAVLGCACLQYTTFDNISRRRCQ